MRTELKDFGLEVWVYMQDLLHRFLDHEFNTNFIECRTHRCKCIGTAALSASLPSKPCSRSCLPLWPLKLVPLWISPWNPINNNKCATIIYSHICTYKHQSNFSNFSFFFIHLCAFVGVSTWFFLIHLGVIWGGCLFFFGLFLLGNWFSHHLFGFFVDFLHIVLDVLRGNDWHLPSGAAGLLLLRCADPSLYSLDVVDHLLPFFRSHMFIFFILNYLNMYQWIDEFEIGVKACNKLTHFISDIFKGFVTFLNVCDFCLGLVNFLNISASIGILTFIVDPGTQLLQEIQDFWDTVWLSVRLMRSWKFFFPGVDHWF